MVLVLEMHWKEDSCINSLDGDH